MPVRDNSFLVDLEKLPIQYRDELRRYRQAGALPQDRNLRAILAGDFRAIVRRLSPELAAVVDVVEKHFPDFSYGSPEFMARWEKIASFEKDPPSGLLQ
jgi:hypothetical protein